MYGDAPVFDPEVLNRTHPCPGAKWVDGEFFITLGSDHLCTYGRDTSWSINMTKAGPRLGLRNQEDPPPEAWAAASCAFLGWPMPPATGRQLSRRLAEVSHHAAMFEAFERVAASLGVDIYACDEPAGLRDACLATVASRNDLAIVSERASELEKIEFTALLRQCRDLVIETQWGVNRVAASTELAASAIAISRILLDSDKPL